MEILNETVYDSGDLVKLIEWARQRVHEAATQKKLKSWQTGSKSKPFNPPKIRDLPDRIRVGYYSPTIPKHGTKEDLKFASRSGSAWDDSLRIGICRPSKFPLNAMEVIARAAADVSTIPDRVMQDLIRRLGGLFGDTYGVTFDIPASLTVRIRQKVNAESAKAAKKLAARQSLERARDNLRYAQMEVDHLEDKLRTAQEKLTRTRARIQKLEEKVGEARV